jgi:hypothetical protein
VTGFASPGRLRPQVFSTSRRLDPPCAYRPCFVPDPLMGFRPTERCSARAAVRRLRRRVPSCRWMIPRSHLDPPEKPERTSGRFARAGRPEPIESSARAYRARPPKRHDTEELLELAQQEHPRLQGFAPRERPPHTSRRFRPARSALLSWAFCPPGCSPSPRRPGLHRSSPHGLETSGRERPSARPSRVSTTARLAGLSRDCRPSWALPPRGHHER